MGFLKRVFGGSQRKDLVIEATEFCCGRFHLPIVGEASYQDELRRLDGGRLGRGEPVEFRVVLIPEPNNQHDSNAICAYAENGGVIGYLCRDNAESIGDAIREFLSLRGRNVACRGVARGGTQDKPSIGVWLDLDTDALDDEI